MNDQTLQGKPRNRIEAEGSGFVVDDTCYPWVAYKGPRFRPIECHTILTDREVAITSLLFDFREFVLGNAIKWNGKTRTGEPTNHHNPLWTRIADAIAGGSPNG